MRVRRSDLNKIVSNKRFCYCIVDFIIVLNIILSCELEINSLDIGLLKNDSCDVGALNSWTLILMEYWPIDQLRFG